VVNLHIIVHMGSRGLQALSVLPVMMKFLNFCLISCIVTTRYKSNDFVLNMVVQTINITYLNVTSKCVGRIISVFTTITH
jgi:hypothetical protein